jgi:hypothetical protein
MTLKRGAFWPLVEIDLAVGVIGFILGLFWAKTSGREMNRDTVFFLLKMFGGISLVFLVIISLAR